MSHSKVSFKSSTQQHPSPPPTTTASSIRPTPTFSHAKMKLSDFLLALSFFVSVSLVRESNLRQKRKHRRSVRHVPRAFCVAVFSLAVRWCVCVCVFKVCSEET